MRLSILKNDPGYSPDAFKGDVKILLDGAEVSECVTADEEGGFVRCYVKGAVPATDVRRGKVEIVKSDNARAAPARWPRK